MRDGRWAAEKRYRLEGTMAAFDGRWSIGTTTVGVLIATCVLLFVLCIGLVYSDADKVVTAERVEIVDAAGKVRMILDGTLEKGPEIQIRDGEGTTRARLAVLGGAGLLVLGPGFGVPRECSIELQADWEAGMMRGGYAGRGSFHLGGDYWGASADVRGPAGIVEGISLNDVAGLRLWDKSGEPQWVGVVKDVDAEKAEGKEGK
jgi:hypothetical protein